MTLYLHFSSVSCSPLPYSQLLNASEHRLVGREGRETGLKLLLEKALVLLELHEKGEGQTERLRHKPTLPRPPPRHTATEAFLAFFSFSHWSASAFFFKVYFF